jgi:hypothetical protein
MHKPVFIIGLHRSGSTLWSRVIQKNDEILLLREMHFLHPWRKDFRYFHKKFLKPAESKNELKSSFELMYENKSFPWFDGSFWQTIRRNPALHELTEIYSKKYFDTERSIADAFRIIIEEFTKFRGYQRCCVKFPVYPTYLYKLIEWYPKSTIIHISRDPRAIYISKNNDPSGIIRKKSHSKSQQYALKKAMLFYVGFQYYLASKIHQKYKYNPNYGLFLFEDLLFSPENTIQKLCKLIGVNYSEDMTIPAKGQPSSITGQVKDGFDKEAGRRWRKVISKHDQIILKTLTQKSMRRFCYDPENHPIFLKDPEKG